MIIVEPAQADQDSPIDNCDEEQDLEDSEEFETTVTTLEPKRNVLKLCSSLETDEEGSSSVSKGQIIFVEPVKKRRSST